MSLDTDWKKMYEVECAGAKSRLERIQHLSSQLAAANLRAGEAENERDAIRELMKCYNVGGWTDAITPMKRALQAEAQRDAIAKDFQEFVDATPRDSTDEFDAARNRAVLALASYTKPWPKACPNARAATDSLMKGKL